MVTVAAPVTTATWAGSVFSTALFWQTAAVVTVVAKTVFPILFGLFMLATILALGELYWIHLNVQPPHTEEETGVVPLPHSIPVTEEAMEAFRTLPCSEEDQKKICQLIRELATGNVWTLIAQRDHLQKLGGDVAHVHPLKFLEVILRDLTHTQHMRAVFADIMKKPGFMKGFSIRLTDSMKDGTMELHLGSFSRCVSGNEAQLSAYCSSQNWTGFIQCLLKTVE